jgi:hypothetical protein
VKAAEEKITEAREAYKFALTTLGTEIGIALWKELDMVHKKVDEIPTRVQENAEGYTFL